LRWLALTIGCLLASLAWSPCGQAAEVGVFGSSKFGEAVWGAPKDSDSDGVPDTSDAFPFDPTETDDSDRDSVGDNADAFPFDPSEQIDGDGDGVGDNSDLFPDDAEEWADDDSDGVGNNADQFDNDPFEAFDTDSDGIGDNTDLDDDGDGYSDEEEIADGTNPLSRFSCRRGCFSFDVDENKEAKALTDGLLIIRHLFGFTNDALISGAVSEDGERKAPEAITALLIEAETELDVDGNGESKALTDGLLLIRYLFGFTGDALIAGATGDGASRTTSAEIEAYIRERIPESD
jgi:hypothetical protein